MIYYIGSGSSDGTDADSQLDSFVAPSYIDTDPRPPQTEICSTTIQSSTDAEASTAIAELQRVQPAYFCVYVSPLKPLYDDERLTALQNDYGPDKTYKFPAHLEYGKCRSFQRCWLEEYRGGSRILGREGHSIRCYILMIHVILQLHAHIS